MQTSLKQQPLGQVCGPQGFLMHCPLLHIWSWGQARQADPPLPQLVSDGLCTQLPWLLQHPPQLEGPHGSDWH